MIEWKSVTKELPIKQIKGKELDIINNDIYYGELESYYKSDLCLIEIVDDEEYSNKRFGVGIFIKYKTKPDEDNYVYEHEYWEVSSFEDDIDRAYNINDKFTDPTDILVTRWTIITK